MTDSHQIPLIAPRPLTRQHVFDGLRLMVFNAQHASPVRARQRAAWIAGQDCTDVVILTEVGTGPGGQVLVDALGERGYFFAPDHAPAASGFRAVLASRGPGLTPVPPRIDVLPHRGPAAAVSFDDHVIGLLGCTCLRAGRGGGAMRTSARSRRP